MEARSERIMILTAASRRADWAAGKAVVGGGDGGGGMEMGSGVGDVEVVGGEEWPLEVDVLLNGDG